MSLIHILTESPQTLTLDLSQLRCRRGVYSGLAVIDGESKEAYGSDGAVSNIHDEAVQRIEDTLGAYFGDDVALECGKKYIISRVGDELQAQVSQ